MLIGACRSVSVCVWTAPEAKGEDVVIWTSQWQMFQSRAEAKQLWDTFRAMYDCSVMLFCGPLPFVCAC